MVELILALDFVFRMFGFCICFGTYSYRFEILEITFQFLLIELILALDFVFRMFGFCICFGTYSYKFEILEITFQFLLIFIRVTASKLFQYFVYSDKLTNVNKIFVTIILYYFCGRVSCLSAAVLVTIVQVWTRCLL